MRYYVCAFALALGVWLGTVSAGQASMHSNQQYFEPWRYGLCHEMKAKAWEAWYRHEYKLAGTP